MIYTGQDYIDNFFAHHGIKGQKWGIRRYQNPDGTLTELGKKRVIDRSGGNKYYQSRFNTKDYTLRKGKRATRVIDTKIEKDDRKDIYVSAGDKKLDKDTKKYIDWIGGEEPTDNIKVRTYEFKKDVKVASGKKVWDNIVKQIGDTKLSDIKKQKWDKNESNVFSDYIDWAESSLNKKYRSAIEKYLETTTLGEAIKYNEQYGASTHNARISNKNKWLDDLASIGLHATRYAALSFTLNKNRLKETTIANLKKQKYGALEDINDPDTELPIIMFNAPKQLKSISTISAKEYKKKP